MKKNNLLIALCALLAPLILFSPHQTSSKERFKIDVGKAKAKKSLLAMPPFQYYGSKGNSSQIKIGQELFNRTLNDLTVTSYFKFIDQKAFLEDTSKVGLRPAPGEKNGFSFKKWDTIDTDFLIRGGYRINASKISFEAYLYYVPQAKLVFAKKYDGPSQAVRKIAHTFANDIVEALTGKKSMFNTQILVSSNRAGLGTKEIFIMDWDGENVRRVTTHRSIAISPAWSPDGKTIAYTAFATHKNTGTRNADLFLYELESQRRWLVSYRKGINSGAAFLPKGKKLLLTVSKGRSPDIYRMNRDGKGLVRLTRGPHSAMNVEPAVSSDGRKIAFSSDRSGRPMIYTMNSNGTGVKRITIAGKYNASPSWSPDGKLIAFAGHDKGHFDIFTMKPDGTNMKRLTSARKKSGKWADNEDPSFSPDGRHIVFTSNRNGHNQLYIINLDGSNERRITFDRFSYFKPKWSPFIE